MRIWILRGLPGSGKTTLATLLHGIFGQSSTTDMWSADDYFTDKDGNYKFDGMKLYEAHKQCQENTRSSMREGVDVIVHNTFTTEKELRPYLEMAKEYGYDVMSLVVENRHGNSSIHDVPEKTLDAMENRFSLKLKP